MRTRVGIGFSQLEDPAEAGRNAVGQAIASLAGQEADFLVLLSTADMDPDQILSSVRSATRAPLVGGCSTGILVPQGPYDHGVAILALTSQEMQVVTSLVCDYSQDPVGAGQTLAQELRAQAEQASLPLQGLLVVVADLGASGTAVAEVVRAIGDEMGPDCQLVGGGARNPSGESKRSIYYGDAAHSNAVAGALVLTANATGVGVRHGYRPFGRVMVVTRVSGSTLYRLDGRSAYQAYVEHFPEATELTTESFGQFALDHPLGLPQIGHEYIIRDPFRAGPNGELFCAGVIPRHAMVQIMQGDKESLIEAAQQSAQESLAPLGGQPPLMGLVFSCVSRLGYLGPAAQDEVSTIRGVLGDQTPFIGLFSFGEIAAQRDSMPAFHNKTAVIGAIGRS